MRAKKNREVNIFSASVVDLFASGLGVFLIVSIIALVNQKKENLKYANPAKVNEANENLVEILETKLNEAQKKLSQKEVELKFLQEHGGNTGEAKTDNFEEKLAAKKEHDQTQEVLSEQIEKIKNLSQAVQVKEDKIQELEKSLESLKKIYKEHDLNKAQHDLHVTKFQVGTKIKLNNVQFYAGTDKAIEPYASREIAELAKVLLENRSIKVEVSGHIFLSQEELAKGDVFDDSNLSGKRAQAVCQKLMALGVSSDRLKCIGYGGSRYLYLTNDQYSEKAQLNRRVEVEVLER